MLILLNGSALLAKPDDINNMTWQQKSHLIQNYLVICETNFEHKVQIFIEDAYAYWRNGILISQG